jgi:hypothetical protein
MPSLMAASNCPARLAELSEFSCPGGLPSGPESAAQFENGPQGRGYNPQARFPCGHRPVAGSPPLFTIRKRPAGPWLQQVGSYARSMYTISPW